MTFEMDGPFREELERSAPERLGGAQPNVAAANSFGLKSTEDKPNSIGAAGQGHEARFSRDLVGTYFRQMGDAELLSREDEIALAKRIEAAQLAVLKGLCTAPLLIERLERWGCELREGRLRLRDLIDLACITT